MPTAPRKDGKGSRRAPVTSPRRARAHPYTRGEQRRFREDVFAALREQDGVFRGTIRTFANLLRKRNAEDPLFSDINRSARRMSTIERLGPIRYEWGKSHNYDCVVAIHLVDADATEPPLKTLHVTHRTRDEAERERRRMELLAYLDHVGGSVASITELAHGAIGAYGDHHSGGTVRADARDLIARKRIVGATGRVRAREVITLRITGAGTRALARYRRTHSGEPPTPTGADAVSQGGGDGAPRAVSAADVARREAIRGTLRAHGGTFTGVLPLARTVSAEHPALGTDRKFEHAIQRMLEDGSLAMSGPRLRGKLLVITLEPPEINQPPPLEFKQPSADATVAPTPTRSEDQAQPDAQPPEVLLLIEADVARAKAEVDHLREERRTLEQRIEEVDHRITAASRRLAQLEQLREAAVATYADPSPTAASSPEEA